MMRKAKGPIGKLRNAPRASTAYHEAGHAALAIIHRIGIRKVTIVPDHKEGSLGHVRKDLRAAPARAVAIEQMDPSDLRSERWLRNHAMVSLGGQVAERIACGRAHGHWRDNQAIAGFLVRLAGDDAEPQRLWGRLLELETKWQLKRHWAGVEAITTALLERQTLTGKEVRAIWYAAFDLTPEQKERVRSMVAAQEQKR